MQAIVSYMNIKTKQSTSIGVDTNKFQLDIYIRPFDIYFTVSNDEKGIKEAINTINKHAPKRIVIQARVALKCHLSLPTRMLIYPL
jgi:hypothetical protein